MWLKFYFRSWRMEDLQTAWVKSDFRNTILIMTSNIGAHILQKMLAVLLEIQIKFLKNIDKILDGQKSFKPNFESFRELVIFRPLAKDSMHAIVELELDKVSERLKEKTQVGVLMKQNNFD